MICIYKYTHIIQYIYIYISISYIYRMSDRRYVRFLREVAKFNWSNDVKSYETNSEHEADAVISSQYHFWGSLGHKEAIASPE